MCTLRTALFWAIRQWVVTIPYRLFRTTYRPHLQGQESSFFFSNSWPVEDGTRSVVPKRRQGINATRPLTTPTSPVLIFFAAEAWCRDVYSNWSGSGDGEKVQFCSGGDGPRVIELRTLARRKRSISLRLFQCARVRAGDYRGGITQLKSDCIKCWQLKSGELSRITHSLREDLWGMVGFEGEGRCLGCVAATVIKRAELKQTHLRTAVFKYIYMAPGGGDCYVK